MTTAPDLHWESWRKLRDPAAFEALVRPELGRALAFARSLGCSDADAEDVLQESLVRLAAERSDGPSRIGVRAWLYRTVRDRAKSRRRSWWRRRDREIRVARPEAAPPRTGDLEVREQVEQALSALPDAEREAVRLRYLQDLDYRDMAHVLGVSENACRIRVHRALEALKKRFGAGVATMVAALPLPVPTHSEHLLREVLRGAIPAAAGKATVAAGWKIAGAAAALAGAGAVAVALLPEMAGPRAALPPHPLVAEALPGPEAAAVKRSDPEMPAPVGIPDEAAEPAPVPAAPPNAPPAADAAVRLDGVASIGWDFGLRASAAEVYGTILRIDPGHAVAAERVKTEDGDTSTGETERKAFDERLEPASVEAARILSDLGTGAAAAGNDARAKDLWALALLVHDQDPVANGRLKSRRVHGKWMTARAEAHFLFEKARVMLVLSGRSTRIRDTKRSTGVPEAAGVPVLRMESDHYLVEADLPARQVTEILGALEAVRAFVHELLRMPDRSPGRSVVAREFVLLSAQDFYERAVDASDAAPVAEREAAKKAGSWRCLPRRVLAFVPDVAAALPGLVHGEAHEVVKETLGALDPWLEEALANLAMWSGPDSGFTICPASARDGERLLQDKAPHLLRGQVIRGRDLPLKELAALPADGLTAPVLAKACSVVLFLLEKDRDATREFLEAAGEAKARKEKGGMERLLSHQFRTFESWQDLDAAWRAWVLEVYRK